MSSWQVGNGEASWRHLRAPRAEVVRARGGVGDVSLHHAFLWDIDDAYTWTDQECDMVAGNATFDDERAALLQLGAAIWPATPGTAEALPHTGFAQSTRDELPRGHRPLSSASAATASGGHPGDAVLRSHADADKRLFAAGEVGIARLLGGTDADGYDWGTPGISHCCWRGVMCAPAAANTSSTAAPVVIDIRVHGPSSIAHGAPETISSGTGPAFHGAISDAVSRLRNLEFVKLQGLALTGTVEDVIATLLSVPGAEERVRGIDLHGNQLDGSIGEGSSVWKLARLTFLILGDNDLEGTLPAGAVSDMRELAYFDVSSNPRIRGPIPESVFSPVIEELYLDHTEFDALPADSVIARATSLLSMDVSFSNSRMGEGGIPPVLFRLPRIAFLYLASSGFTGSIPDMTQTTSLRWFLAGGNALIGSFPPGFFSLSKLQHFRVEDNRLRDRLDRRIANLKALEAFDMCNNLMVGFAIPHLACECRNLTFWIVTGGLHLTGSIPPCIGNLTKLRLLHLAETSVVGTLPGAALSGLPNLSQLHLYGAGLQGTIPPELFGPNSSNLRSLLMSSNLLTGSIPETLNGVNLPKLEWLSLANNNLVSTVPAGFASLSSLRIAYLSTNQLSGTLPGLSELRSLETLDLRDNQLTCEKRDDGSSYCAALEEIPPRLQTLELDRNDLRGSVPSKLLRLDNATRIKINFNHWSCDFNEAWQQAGPDTLPSVAAGDLLVLEGSMLGCPVAPIVDERDPAAKTYLCGYRPIFVAGSAVVLAMVAYAFVTWRQAVWLATQDLQGVPPHRSAFWICRRLPSLADDAASRAAQEGRIPARVRSEVLNYLRFARFTRACVAAVAAASVLFGIVVFDEVDSAYDCRYQLSFTLAFASGGPDWWDNGTSAGSLLLVAALPAIGLLAAFYWTDRSWRMRMAYFSGSRFSSGVRNFASSQGAPPTWLKHSTSRTLDIAGLMDPSAPDADETVYEDDASAAGDGGGDDTRKGSGSSTAASSTIESQSSFRNPLFVSKGSHDSGSLAEQFRARGGTQGSVQVENQRHYELQRRKAEQAAMLGAFCRRTSTFVAAIVLTVLIMIPNAAFVVLNGTEGVPGDVKVGAGLVLGVLKAAINVKLLPAASRSILRLMGVLVDSGTQSGSASSHGPRGLLARLNARARDDYADTKERHGFTQLLALTVSLQLLNTIVVPVLSVLLLEHRCLLNWLSPRAPSHITILEKVCIADDVFRNTCYSYVQLNVTSVIEHPFQWDDSCASSVIQVYAPVFCISMASQGLVASAYKISLRSGIWVGRALLAVRRALDVCTRCNCRSASNRRRGGSALARVWYPPPWPTLLIDAYGSDCNYVAMGLVLGVLAPQLGVAAAVCLWASADANERMVAAALLVRRSETCVSKMGWLPQGFVGPSKYPPLAIFAISAAFHAFFFGTGMLGSDAGATISTVLCIEAVALFVVAVTADRVRKSRMPRDDHSEGSRERGTTASFATEGSYEDRHRPLLAT